MIKSIEIKNFKSIIDSGVIHLPSFGAIVGCNASGKTNLIQSLNFIKLLASGLSITDAQRHICLVPNELFNLNLPANQLTIRIEMQDLKNNEYRFELTIELKSDISIDNNFKIIYEKLEKKDNNSEEHYDIIYERDPSQFKGKDGPIPLKVDSETLAITVYDNKDTIDAKQHLSSIVITEQKVTDNRDSIVSYKDNNLAGLIVRFMSGDENDNYKNFIDITSKILENFSSFNEVKPRYKGKNVSNGDRISLVMLEEHNVAGQLSMQSLSLGDLRTMYFIAKSLDLREGASLFIEEIENGMHPNRLKNLLDHLDNISHRKHIQTIFTTHSPNVIDHLKPQDIILTYKDKIHGTKYQRIDSHKDSAAISNFLDKGGSLFEYLSTRFD